MFSNTKLVHTANKFTSFLQQVKQDYSHYAKELQTFWKGVIEECGDTFANAFEVDIEKNNSICKLKDIIKKKNTQTFANIDTKDIRLWKVKIPDDRKDQLINLLLQNKDKLLATRKILKYFSSSPQGACPCYCQVVILEEALLCIPPSIISNDCFKSKDTTRVNGDSPISVLLWEDFFKEVSHFHFKEHPRFERTNFVVKEIINKEDVQDLNCHYLAKLLILVIEVKREHILQDISEQTFPDFYKMNRKARMVVQQIYNYMGKNELRYGILTTYENH
ncbi:hypothetical protein RhiirA4_472404 [Rhizophagus irregularis]|uniref:Crinkler effector protein N-terminal domain-containing protein n=1 Tax=Rhizophagus irregularis TaxID=588596 RepID=A0A2I1H4W8_9GLOM|nr:hypothetical protein RhiirA4_472404 [Rhizophagus irregularis]